MANEHIQESVPIEPAPYFGDPSDEEPHVFCPHCFRPTESLKAYTIVIVWVFGVIGWSSDKVIACPNCMRKAIGKNALIAVLVTNLLFPLMAIVYFLQFLASFSAGHSDLQIANANRRSLEERFADVKEAVTLWTWERINSTYFWLIFIAVFVILAIIAALASEVVDKVFRLG